MNDIKPRGAIIGCGDISPTHLKSYEEAGIELVALCDLVRDRAEKRRTESGGCAVVYTDAAEMLARERLDLVTVAVPVASHVPLTLMALQAGKHVLCEKPSALDAAENRAVIAAAKTAGKKMVFFSSRMRWGHVAMAKRLIEAGRLGTIYRVDVRFARRRGRPGVDIIEHARWFVDQSHSGGGVIMDMGNYFMDMVLDLTGWPTLDTVSATTFRGHAHRLPADVRFDVEEHCTILARTRQRVSLSFDLAWIGHHEERMQVSVLGTNGGIHLDMMPTAGREPFTFMHDGGSDWEWMDTTTRFRDKVSGNTHVYRDFIEAMSGKPVAVGTTPEQALAVTELTCAALTSARTGREVVLTA